MKMEYFAKIYDRFSGNQPIGEKRLNQNVTQIEQKPVQFEVYVPCKRIIYKNSRPEKQTYNLIKLWNDRKQ
jgi:hypothetical protein